MAVAQTHIPHTYFFGHGKKSALVYCLKKDNWLCNIRLWFCEHLGVYLVFRRRRSSTEAKRPHIVRPLSTLLKYLQKQQRFVNRHNLKTYWPVTYSFSNTLLSSHPSCNLTLCQAKLTRCPWLWQHLRRRTFTLLFAKCGFNLKRVQTSLGRIGTVQKQLQNLITLLKWTVAKPSF